MKQLKLDTNGIWISEDVIAVSYPNEGNKSLLDVEEKSFWFQHRNNVIKTVIKRFPFKKNFVDIGGGNGFQASFLAENFSSSDVFFLEPGYEGCLNAKARGLKNVYNIPFQYFDFVQKNIDAVGLFDVVEHIDDDVKFLTELRSKLPKGSLIYMTVPAHNYLWSDADDFGGHFRRYNLKMIKELAIKTDLELVFSSYFFFYVPPITYFLKHLPYKIRGKRVNKEILDSEMKQLSPSKIVSSVFSVLHNYELKRLSNGTMMNGGSCFGVFKV
ncbi:MAG: methyltransferase domain-containing protein [Bacteroidetes bacterium]|nr:methyltransferase domain-containing protein [Bacteroidota bacterium]